MGNPFKDYDWENWLAGMWAAVVGGGAQAVVGAVGLNLTDPSHFNGTNKDFYKVVGVLFGTAATVNFFMFLKQSPLPGRLVSKTTTTLTVEKTVGTKEPLGTGEPEVIKTESK